MRAWYAGLTERQKTLLAVVCTPLVPFAALAAMIALPFMLMTAAAGEALEDIFGERRWRD